MSSVYRVLLKTNKHYIPDPKVLNFANKYYRLLITSNTHVPIHSALSFTLNIQQVYQLCSQKLKEASNESTPATQLNSNAFFIKHPGRLLPTDLVCQQINKNEKLNAAWRVVRYMELNYLINFKKIFVKSLDSGSSRNATMKSLLKSLQSQKIAVQGKEPIYINIPVIRN